MGTLVRHTKTRFSQRVDARTLFCAFLVVLAAGCSHVVPLASGQPSGVAHRNQTSDGQHDYMLMMPDESSHQLVLSIPEQRMVLVKNQAIIREYKISTARSGAGETVDSATTPRGLHVIAEKIGADIPKGMIFRGREPTGEYSELDPTDIPPPVVSRLFRLRGLETRNVNTYERLIYLHGSPHEKLLGQPASGGCIRMSSDDVIELFDMIRVGTPITIVETSIVNGLTEVQARSIAFKAFRKHAITELSKSTPDIATVHHMCVGHMYGADNVPINHLSALYWCEKAAGLGASSSMTLLAELHESGSVGPSNFEKARALYERAAAMDHPHALGRLAKMQVEGLGGPKDLVQSAINMERRNKLLNTTISRPDGASPATVSYTP